MNYYVLCRFVAIFLYLFLLPLYSRRDTPYIYTSPMTACSPSMHSLTLVFIFNQTLYMPPITVLLSPCPILPIALPLCLFLPVFSHATLPPLALSCSFLHPSAYSPPRHALCATLRRPADLLLSLNGLAWELWEGEQHSLQECLFTACVSPHKYRGVITNTSPALLDTSATHLRFTSTRVTFSCCFFGALVQGNFV